MPRGWAFDGRVHAQQLGPVFLQQGRSAKGRQMPIHYGSKGCTSKPFRVRTTQLPQAAGAAYAYKLAGSAKLSFISTVQRQGDFHPALNMSTTLKCPMIFLPQQWVRDLDAREGSIHRRWDHLAWPGHGMASLRVDGNDVLPSTRLNRSARHRGRATVTHQAMTYRQGTTRLATTRHDTGRSE